MFVLYPLSYNFKSVNTFVIKYQSIDWMGINFDVDCLNDLMSYAATKTSCGDVKGGKLKDPHQLKLVKPCYLCGSDQPYAQVSTGGPRYSRFWYSRF